MIRKIKNNNKAKFCKLNYICYDKIESIPQINFKRNSEVFNYNNSVEVEQKLNKKITKVNKNTPKNKPLLSDRIKKNSKKKKKNENFQNNNMHNKNKTENNNSLNLMDINDNNKSYLNHGFNGSNIGNIFDKNIIINNNNYDKKIIYY